jgi:O-methyltransferase involved in polyketide biosynthesis
MLEALPSRTAERVAVERAAHQQLDHPLVLVDPFAMQVIDPRHMAALREHPERHDLSPIAKPTRAIVVVRSRIAEDELARAAAAGVTQYVLLGAGLDTFAYRNPHASVRASVMQTLSSIGSMPAGTAVVFDYALPPASLGWIAKAFCFRALDRLKAAGEPWTSFFEPGPLRRDLLDRGFTDIEDLGADEINARYLAGRRDGLKTASIGHIVTTRK